MLCLEMELTVNDNKVSDSAFSLPDIESTQKKFRN